MNIKRRHLNKGQQAIAIAMMCPQGRKGKSEVPKQDFSKQRLSEARLIVNTLPEMTKQVLAGVACDDVARDHAGGAVGRCDGVHWPAAHRSRLLAQSAWRWQVGHLRAHLPQPSSAGDEVDPCRPAAAI
jgi:hypothetical protein